jgi:hypothetical protein
LKNAIILPQNPKKESISLWDPENHGIGAVFSAEPIYIAGFFVYTEDRTVLRRRRAREKKGRRTGACSSAAHGAAACGA